MVIKDIMVKVSESKYDNNGRITCSVKIAELLDLEKGIDVIEWHVEGGKVVLKKRTKQYRGFDLESEEITERLKQYEADHLEEAADEELDPMERLRIAEEEYERDKQVRIALREKKRKQ